MHWQRDIEVLTPLFNRGAYQDTPEIRVPSIRGMVRWWFRALGGSPDEEKLVFGGMKKFGQRTANDVMASRLVFRVSKVTAHKANPDPATLPHKQGGQASPRAAFQAGAKLTLQVFSRFEPLPSELERKAINALEVWTLLGSLGLRANRGGGSLWPSNAPNSPEELKQRLKQLGCTWPVYLAPASVGNTWLDLQKAATDTVQNGPANIFGSVRPHRQSSPLKLKVVRLDGQLRLLITAPEERIISEAQRALRQKHQPALSQPDTWAKISP